jgi:hypothetical protein
VNARAPIGAPARREQGSTVDRRPPPGADRRPCPGRGEDSSRPGRDGRRHPVHLQPASNPSVVSAGQLRRSRPRPRRPYIARQEPVRPSWPDSMLSPRERETRTGVPPEDEVRVVQPRREFVHRRSVADCPPAPPHSVSTGRPFDRPAAPRAVLLSRRSALKSRLTSIAYGNHGRAHLSRSLVTRERDLGRNPALRYQ